MDVNPDRLVVRARECFDGGDAYGADPKIAAYLKLLVRVGG
jgi:hypothetical protein